MSEEKQIAKKSKQGKGEIGKFYEPETKPGDNKKYLMVSMQLAALPPVDLKDSEAVQERIKEFFTIQAENDLKPTVAGLGLALGLDRRRVYEIRTGRLKGYHTPYDLPTLTVDSIKKAHEIMENMWENYMQNGKINPVAGIFLGKNNFGYQNDVECIITPNMSSDSEYDADDIKRRYLSIEAPNDFDSDS